MGSLGDTGAWDLLPSGNRSGQQSPESEHEGWDTAANTSTTANTAITIVTTSNTTT